ncbi:MAG: hypothetical protein WCJ33_07570 [Pseudomonadota bacterium]
MSNNQFSVNFTPNPLQLPDNAENCKIEIISGQIWNSSPNVITGKNDVFTIQDASGIHSINIEQGQYDVDSLYQQIALQFNNKPSNQAMYFSSFETVFKFVPNYSTQKLSIEFLYIDNASLNQVRILWNQSTITELLGYTSSSPTRPSKVSTIDANYSITGESYGKFNAYNSFIIQSDLVDTGISINNNYSQIIGQIDIPPNSVGSLISYRATNPNVFALCNNLRGSTGAKYQCVFRIRDENGDPIIMPDNWFITVMISWFEE